MYGRNERPRFVRLRRLLEHIVVSRHFRTITVSIHIENNIKSLSLENFMRTTRRLFCNLIITNFKNIYNRLLCLQLIESVCDKSLQKEKKKNEFRPTSSFQSLILCVFKPSSKKYNFRSTNCQTIVWRQTCLLVWNSSEMVQNRGYYFVCLGFSQRKSEKIKIMSRKMYIAYIFFVLLV